MLYRVDAAYRRKWGYYLPWQRLNVDQVPLPFVNNMDYTYAERGKGRVAINQGGPSLSKRQATGQLCFRPVEPPASGFPDTPQGRAARNVFKEQLLAQPAPCLIFRGQGHVYQEELDAYPPGLVVLWQPKAWVDRPTAMQWVEKVIKPFMNAERKAGVVHSSYRYVLFEDNLDAQKQPEYIAALAALGVDDHKVPPDHTDEAQPIDRGLGWHVKLYMGQEMDAWLEVDENLAKWESTEKGETLTAKDRRILLAQWYYKAVKRALQGEAKRKYFEHAGALLTADGTDDDLVKLEAAPAAYKLHIPSPTG